MLLVCYGNLLIILLVVCLVSLNLNFEVVSVDNVSVLQKPIVSMLRPSIGMIHTKGGSE